MADSLKGRVTEARTRRALERLSSLEEGDFTAMELAMHAMLVGERATDLTRIARHIRFAIGQKVFVADVRLLLHVVAGSPALPVLEEAEGRLPDLILRWRALFGSHISEVLRIESLGGLNWDSVRLSALSRSSGGVEEKLLRFDLLRMDRQPFFLEMPASSLLNLLEVVLGQLEDLGDEAFDGVDEDEVDDLVTQMNSLAAYLAELREEEEE